jgi:hypothetical protein
VAMQRSFTIFFVPDIQVNWKIVKSEVGICSTGVRIVHSIAVAI